VAKNKFVGPIHGRERVLSDGRVIVPGEEFELDDEAQKDEHNKRLIESGQVLAVDQNAKPKKSGGE
jgi:hypothetical protein